jgi:nucleoside-specific outer membrane channel protein Tsx
MVDNTRFSDDLRKLIEPTTYTGEAMIAVSRAILRNIYEDFEYNNEFFSTFILIDEESGNIILDGYGEFNIPSNRHALSNNLIADSVKAIISSIKTEHAYSNGKIHQREIEAIASSYEHTFLSSLNDFKAFFGI